MHLIAEERRERIRNCIDIIEMRYGHMEKRKIGRMSIVLLLGLVLLTMTVSAVTIIPICTDPYDQRTPAISGNTIVWMDFRNGNWDIYKWDPVHGEQPVITDPSDQWNPAISGDTIVWEDDRNGNLDIYKWDPVNGERQVTTDPKSQAAYPEISGDTIVWHEGRNGNGDIYKWDPVNGERQVTTDPKSQAAYPAISGDTIVWADWRNGNGDIYKWDPVNGGQPVTTNTAKQEYPAISGDTIVWQDDRNGNDDIYKWDPVNGEQRVTTNTAKQEYPEISGDTIVWADWRNGNENIYKWDPVNGEQRVTTGQMGQAHLAISGNTIVWHDWRNGNGDIYAATLTSITVTSPNGGETWQRGTTHTVTWSYTGDPGKKMKIVLLKGDIEVGTIESSVPRGSGGIGSYTWSIPSSGTIGSDYKVRIQSMSQPSIKDESNIYFTISSRTPTPSITVMSPNGGESWKRGTTHTIAWDYAGKPGSSVKIELLTGDTLYKVLTPSTKIGKANHGSYSWKISATTALGTNYKIQVTSTSNSVYSDTSNANFVIN